MRPLSVTSFQSSCATATGITPFVSRFESLETPMISLIYPNMVLQSPSSSNTSANVTSFSSNPLGLGNLRYESRGGCRRADVLTEDVMLWNESKEDSSDEYDTEKDLPRKDEVVDGNGDQGQKEFLFFMPDHKLNLVDYEEPPKLSKKNKESPEVEYACKDNGQEIPPPVVLLKKIFRYLQVYQRLLCHLTGDSWKALKSTNLFLGWTLWF